MNKIPLVSISEMKWEPDDSSYYFAMCSPNNTQATDFQECRECVIQEVVLFHVGSVYVRREIDKNRTSVLVARLPEDDNIDTIEKEVHRGLKIVHHFERLAGWPKSRLYGTYESEFVYLFRGNKCWQRSSYSLSLYLFLIRLGRHEEFEEFKTHSDFSRAWNAVYEKRTLCAQYDIEHPLYDCRFLTCKMLKQSVLFVKKQTELFEGRRTKGLFRSVYSNDYGYFGDGIQNLCSFKTRDKYVNNKFQKLCNRYSV